MSRVGKQPVAVPGGVKVNINGRKVAVEGPLGKLEIEHRPEVSLDYAQGGAEITVVRKNDEREARALHGLTRALLQNMIVGVTQGYEKKLEIQGVGYLAAIKDNVLQLRVGFANEVHKVIPKDLQVSCPDQTHVVIKGCDKQRVGQFAAEVRSVRKPEPYKGKGVRYQGEHVKLKPGKQASK